MLTKEVIKANAQLATLTDEQLQVIETLSKNDEDAVIGQKIGEVHRQYDETILKATGLSRNGDEKSYVYLERAAGELKKLADSTGDLQTKIKGLEGEKERLEKAVKDNAGDAELKRQLDSANAELAQTKTQFNDLNTKYTEEQANNGKKLHEMQVDFELRDASSKLAFKPEYPEALTKTILSNAFATIKQNKAEFIDDGNNGKRLVFKNAEGATLNNPENGLNPYTASELLNGELKKLGVLAEPQRSTGTGTGGQKANSNVKADISGAKTRVEANEIINQSLMSQGLTRGSDAYQEAMTAAWKDNNVSALPEK